MQAVTDTSMLLVAAVAAVVPAVTQAQAMGAALVQAMQVPFQVQRSRTQPAELGVDTIRATERVRPRILVMVAAEPAADSRAVEPEAPVSSSSLRLSAS